jgi:hypothetical protein
MSKRRFCGPDFHDTVMLHCIRECHPETLQTFRKSCVIAQCELCTGADMRVDRQQTITPPSRVLYRPAGQSARGKPQVPLPRVEELLEAPRCTLLQQAGCPAFARHNGQPAIFAFRFSPIDAALGP